MKPFEELEVEFSPLGDTASVSDVADSMPSSNINGCGVFVYTRLYFICNVFIKFIGCLECLVAAFV